MQIKNLYSFHILENVNKTNLITWIYPSISEDIRAFTLTNCYSTLFPSDGLFYYKRERDFWLYIKQFSVQEKKLAVIVVTKDFLPTVYKTLTEILAEKYAKNGNPVELVKYYLKCCIAGAIELQDNGKELLNNLGKNKITNNSHGLLDLIQHFGLETIVIYNALLLKKRILTYHPSIKDLQESMLAITCLVPARNTNEYVIPFIQDEENLKEYSFYLAGTTNEYDRNNETLYDLYLDLASHKFITSTKGKVLLEMTKFHKDIAHFLVELGASASSESQVIAEIGKKTDELINHLKSLGRVDGNSTTVSVEDIKLKKYNTILENFLRNLAIAENLLT